MLVSKVVVSGLQSCKGALEPLCVCVSVTHSGLSVWVSCLHSESKAEANCLHDCCENNGHFG